MVNKTRASSSTKRKKGIVLSKGGVVSRKEEVIEEILNKDLSIKKVTSFDEEGALLIKDPREKKK